jgi:hypothetical protein
LPELKGILKKKKDKVNIKMLNVKFAQMETILMTISSSFAACVTSVYINVALAWQKFQPKAGFVMFAWPSGQRV